MNSILDWGQFQRGVVVIEKEPLWEDNPGHVVGFVRDDDGHVLIRVEFANGDRYNVHPSELDVL